MPDETPASPSNPAAKTPARESDFSVDAKERKAVKSYARAVKTTQKAEAKAMKAANRKAVKANLAAIHKLKTSYPPSGIGQTMGAIAFASWAMYILNIIGPKMVTGWIDLTSMAVAADTTGGGNKVGTPSMYTDPGELDVEVFFDPSTFPPPIGKHSTGTLTLTIGPSAKALSFTATMLGFEPKMPLEGRGMTADLKFRISGAIA
jgi:hypothetical protein